jgi:hypothetical protein
MSLVSEAWLSPEKGSLEEAYDESCDYGGG